jgi:hypothetical protein
MFVLKGVLLLCAYQTQYNAMDRLVSIVFSFVAIFFELDQKLLLFEN